ncbi:DNA replication terminus site-binding protein [uncultured Ferrimonas sp.]|uniref:DNA replication terminus site-binding protein n=1 Tax=uncultured Ferrimonas sp. TaxID=432640 RepID=UPI0026278CB7|nr:DNA replication terminus site-binding protein [uncultured Ferrimonas sp.]
MSPIDEQQKLQLQRLYQHSAQAREDLLQRLQQHAPAQVQLFQLPKALQTRPLHRFDQIEVTPLSGSVAQQPTLNALHDLHRHGDDLQSQRVRRYPGIVRYHNDIGLMQAQQQLQHSIDAFKAQLHQDTERFSNKQDLRFKLLHEIAPNLITMHYYRAPMVLSQPVRRIRFGWVAKRIVAKINKADILARLNNSLTTPGKVIADMPAWRQSVEQEYRAIDSLPASVQLRIDREGGLRPTAFIQYSHGGRSQCPANLPLLLQQAQPLEVAPLPNWQQSSYPSAKGELLIPRLHLYRLN